jgi:hypothetical protein
MTKTTALIPGALGSVSDAADQLGYLRNTAGLPNYFYPSSDDAALVVAVAGRLNESVTALGCGSPIADPATATVPILDAAIRALAVAWNAL